MSGLEISDSRSQTNSTIRSLALQLSDDFLGELPRMGAGISPRMPGAGVGMYP